MSLLMKRELDQPLSAKEVEEYWARGRPTFIGLVVMATVLAFIHHEFAGPVPPKLLYPWLGYMSSGIAVVLAMIGAYFIPSLRASVKARTWRNYGNMASFIFCSGIAASVWLLMPFVDDMLRMVMIFLYMWFVAMVMLSNGDRITVAGALVVLVSAASFTLVEGMPYASALAGFLIMAGVALVTMRRMIWRAADEAAAARAEAQRSADALHEALEMVRAERDARTRFIASASHDLQQPLAAASLYFDQVLSGRDRPVREGAAVGVKRALASTQSLLQTMLDHLRLEAGAMPVRLTSVVLDDVMQDIAIEHGPAAQLAGVKLTAVRCRLVVTGDYQLLRRTLGNLVSNALRHAHGTRILIGGRLKGGGAELLVIDDGNGIAAADIERLFDDYSQGSDHGLESRGGFGLGLASARRMMDLMNSHLRLDQRWRGGSAFAVTIPDAIRDSVEGGAWKAA